MNSLEFAINMEIDGEKYYKQQAELNKDNSLNTIFLMLAKDEENHARILQKKFNELSYELEDNDTLFQSKNIFKGIMDKGNIVEISNQLELYREALQNENLSFNLYQEFLAEATDDKEKELFEYLSKQERVHLEILEDLITLINRPNEWVENAEFGDREEY